MATAKRKAVEKKVEDWIYSIDGNICVRASSILGFRVSSHGMRYRVLAHMCPAYFQTLGMFEYKTEALEFIADCTKRINKKLTIKVEESKDVENDK